MSQVTKRGRFLALVLVLLLMISSAAIAQVINGSITGEVRDASGAFIPKATVTIEDKSIGVHVVTTSDARGIFFVPSLPKGTYSITVTASGFKKLDKVDIPLSNGDHLNAGAFTLAVGAAQETVTVAADAGQIQIQSQSAERSDTVDSKQLDVLPMNGQMILDFLKVVPGINSTYNGADATKGGLGTIQVNGARNGQTGFLINGMNNMDNGANNSSQITVNPDAIAEVKVLTSNYQAEYGKTAAGQISLTTKAGENQFHGNLRWFHRGEGFNAEQWFDKQANYIWHQANPNSPLSQEPNPKQKYRYNYFGGQLSGPVIIPGTDFNKNRDKLFFFFGQEWYNQMLPGGFGNVYVPTLDEIKGDFSKSTDGHGNKLTVKDPKTGIPYPGNIVPSTSINPAIQAMLLNVYPRPNATDTNGGGWNRYNYVFGLTNPHPRREDIYRLDYQINASNRAYYNLINNTGHQGLPKGLWGGGANFNYLSGTTLQEPGYSNSVHLTSTISPTVVNDLSFGWTINYLTASAGAASVKNFTDLNIPLLYQVADSATIPDFSFGGISNQTGTWTWTGNLPYRNALTVIDFNDSLSKMVGKHIVKMGVFAERSRKNQAGDGNANGTFGFQTGSSNYVQAPGLDTGNPYANALLGNYSSFQQQNGRVYGFFRYSNIEFFLQDTYKATRRLTFDYGMRFAWVQPQYDANNQVSYFDPSAWDPAKAVRLYKPTAANGGATGYDSVSGTTVPQNLIGTVVPGSGNPTNGMVTAAAGGFRGGFKDRGLMPEPRFGFAYDVLGNSKVVVRGGAGVTHDRFQGNPIYSLVFSNLSRPNPSFAAGTLAGIPALQAAAPNTPLYAYGFDKNGMVPTIFSYSLGVQADIGWKTMLDVAYVGNQQKHLSQKHNMNAIPYGTTFTLAAQDPSKYVNNNHVVTDESGWIGSAWTSQGFHFMGDNAFNQVFLAPYQGFQDIQYWTWDGIGNYNSLQVSAHRRFGNNLTFGVAYTYSKTLATSGSDGQWTNIISPRKYNYTNVGFDRPQNLVVNYSYNLPKFSKYLGGSKWLSYLTDGYSWEGVGLFIKGGPGTVGGGFTMPWGASEQPMITGSWTEPPLLQVTGNPTVGNGGNPYSHLNPNAFTLPQIGTPTPQKQNYYRNGGTNNIDMSVLKNIPLGNNEARYLQLRAEAFNIFNHPQFWGINNGTGNANINGNTDPWGSGLFGNWGQYGANGWQHGSVIEPYRLRPAGQKGNLGNYFGEFSNGGNARVLQLGVKLYF